MRWYLVYGQPGIRRIATDRFEDRETAIARARELYRAGFEVFCLVSVGLASIGGGEHDLIEGDEIGKLCAHARERA